MDASQTKTLTSTLSCYLKQARHSQLLKKASGITLGYIIAQLLLILSTPILTRLYPPDAFAQLGYVMAFAALLLPAASLRLEFAIPLTENEQQASCLLLVSGLIVIASSFVITGLLWLFHDLLNAYLAIDSTMLYCLFGIFILQGICQILRLHCIHQDRVGLVAHGKIIQNITMIAAQLALIFVIPQAAIALIAGYLIGLVCNALYLMYKALGNVEFSKAALKLGPSLLKKYYKFPLHSSWTSVLDSAAAWVPVFFIGILFGQTYAGIYFLVNRVFQIPTGLLATVLSQLLLKRFADCFRAQQSLQPLVKKSFLLLGSMGGAYLIGMYAIAPFLPWLFGANWNHSSLVLAIIAPAIVAAFCVSPLTNIFGVVGRNEICSLWQILYLVMTAGAIGIGYLSGNFIIFLCALAIAWVLSYIIYGILVYGVAKV